MQPEFVVTTQSHGESAIVRCAGEVDIATADRLVEALDVALKNKPEFLEIDLSDVSFFSAVGLDVLTGAQKNCGRIGTEMHIRLSTPAKRVLDIIDPAELMERVVDSPHASSRRFCVFPRQALFGADSHL